MLKSLIALSLCLCSITANAKSRGYKSVPQTYGPKFEFKTEVMGTFNAPKSRLSEPNKEARERLFIEGPVTQGRFKGEAMELFERRPPVILDANLKTSDGQVKYDSSLTQTILEKYNLQEGDALVANIEHLQKFYVALIPTQSVQSMDMMYAIFMEVAGAPVASHYLTVFNFDPEWPVMLVAEIPTEQERLEGGKIKMLDIPIIQNQLVLSIEGTYALNHGPYDLVNGMNGWFSNSFLWTTVPSRLQENLENGFPHHRYRSFFNKKDVNSILQEALHTSDRAGLEILYHTIFTNCTTLAMDIYRRATSDELAEQIADFFTNVFQVYPVINESFGSDIRGYKANYSRMPDLEKASEFKEEYNRLKTIYSPVKP